MKEKYWMGDLFMNILYFTSPVQYSSAPVHGMVDYTSFSFFTFSIILLFLMFKW